MTTTSNPYELSVEAIDRFNRATIFLFKPRAHAVEVIQQTGDNKECREEHSLGIIDRTYLRRWLKEPYCTLELGSAELLLDVLIDPTGRMALRTRDLITWVLSPMEEERLYRFL